LKKNRESQTDEACFSALYNSSIIAKYGGIETFIAQDEHPASKIKGLDRLKELLGSKMSTEAIKELKGYFPQ
jgi:hypothetical protein